MAAERAKTGTSKLDEILGGGIPRGSTVLVLGSPGTGKTLFAWQFLYNGAKLFSEPGVFVTLEERPDDMRRNLLGFGWDIKALESRGSLAIIDAASAKIGLPSREKYVEQKPFDLDSLMYRIHTVCREIEAKRLAVDSVSALGFRLEEAQIRDSIYKLNALLLEIGATSLLTLEKTDAGASLSSGKFKAAEYISHGLIDLELIEKERELKRFGVVVKMRGTKHSTKFFPFEIGEGGIALL